MPRENHAERDAQNERSDVRPLVGARTCHEFVKHMCTSRYYL